MTATTDCLSSIQSAAASLSPDIVNTLSIRHVFLYFYFVCFFSFRLCSNLLFTQPSVVFSEWVLLEATQLEYIESFTLSSSRFSTRVCRSPSGDARPLVWCLESLSRNHPCPVRHYCSALKLTSFAIHPCIITGHWLYDYVFIICPYISISASIYRTKPRL